ncbi:DUF5320 domain-containing protein [Desulfitobacterium hafniense]|uniref:DUF5320 domain-containing protein n=1 Tax=Desulfitobacterium hafniense TaxID=49338 RepID=UPI0009B749AB|nr:DUF5320 domain-containing protein [Desulfitobacterium hafniense]
MPGRDGTGPSGVGSMSGRGFGLCSGANGAQPGLGRMGLPGRAPRRGFGSGYGSGFAVSAASSKTQRELLQEHRDRLQNRIASIDKQLESL